MHPPDRPDDVPATEDADAEGVDIAAPPGDGATDPAGTDEGWVEV